MKLGLKGGKGGIKALALQHGEKIGMALVAICVALFIYKISGHERLPADNTRFAPRQNETYDTV